jgi:hypothetical protein
VNWRSYEASGRIQEAFGPLLWRSGRGEGLVKLLQRLLLPLAWGGRRVPRLGSQALIPPLLPWGAFESSALKQPRRGGNLGQSSP